MDSTFSGPKSGLTIPLPLRVSKVYLSWYNKGFCQGNDGIRGIWVSFSKQNINSFYSKVNQSDWLPLLEAMWQHMTNLPRLRQTNIAVLCTSNKAFCHLKPFLPTPRSVYLSLESQSPLAHKVFFPLALPFWKVFIPANVSLPDFVVLCPDSTLCLNFYQLNSHFQLNLKLPECGKLPRSL